MTVRIHTTESLTQDQRQAFERDSYVLVEDALGSETVERLVDAVNRVWERHRGDGSPDFLHLLGFLGEDELFLELLDWPSTFPFVSNLLGWSIFMYHCHLDVHPPLLEHPQPSWGWHQDGGRQNLEIETHPRPRLSMKIAYVLSDLAEPRRGNMLVIPGSHRWDVLPRPKDGLTRPAEAVPMLARAGDAFVFDRRLWHSKTPNLSGITRRMLFFAYTYRWVRPRDDIEIDPE